jgi:hypothetical protein
MDFQTWKYQGGGGYKMKDINYKGSVVPVVAGCLF